MNWIDITKELPLKNQVVIGYRPLARKNGDDTVTILKYEGNLWPDLNGISHGFERNHHCSHWMPLPEPPDEFKINEYKTEL